MKVTNESPQGLKNNLLKTWGQMQPSFLNCEAENQQKIFTRICYGISFFHAVLQERRKYGSLGFTESYNFNEGDLYTSFIQASVIGGPAGGSSL